MDDGKVTKIAVVITMVVILLAAIGIAFVITNGNSSVEQINARKSDYITGVVNAVNETNDVIENIAVNNSVNNTTNTTVTNTNTNTVNQTELPKGYSEVNETVWATTTVRVRKTPSTDSDSNIIGSLFQNNH